jgi:hypothetical protein
MSDGFSKLLQYICLAGLLALGLGAIISTGGGGGGQADYSGTYCLYLNGDIIGKPMVIDQSQSEVTFAITMDGSETLEGTGTVSGNTMTLTAEIPEGGEARINITFSEDGQGFSGTYETTGENPDQGSLTGEKGECVVDLPDISEINAAKSDTFIVPLAELGVKVQGVAPMPGLNSGCYHNGAHVVFTKTASRQTVEIIAPLDGVITLVDKCFTYADGARDQYKIHMAYAQKGGSIFELELAIEPMAGLLCRSGDPDYFSSYIFVEEGDRVVKGQTIGEMVLEPGFQAHIHCNSRYQGEFLCPDIFNADVIDYIDDYYDGIPDTCNGTPYSDIAVGTICYKPKLGESHDDY